MTTSIILPIEKTRLPEIPLEFGKAPDWSKIEEETDKETAETLKKIMGIAGIELADISKQGGAEFSKAKLFRWEEVLEEIVKIFPDFKPETSLEDDGVSWPIAFKKVSGTQDENHFYLHANRLVCEIRYLTTSRKSWGYDQLAWAGRYGRKFAECISTASVQEERRVKKEKILEKVELGDATVRIIERILSETNISRFALTHYSFVVSKKEKPGRKDLEKVRDIMDEELEK